MAIKFGKKSEVKRVALLHGEPQKEATVLKLKASEVKESGKRSDADEPPKKKQKVDGSLKQKKKKETLLPGLHSEDEGF